MRLALFMDKFPSFPETYVLWHIAELLRAGQDVTLYPAHADWGAARLQPEVGELEMMSHVVAPGAPHGTGRVERASELLGVLGGALARHPGQALASLGMLRDTGGLNVMQVWRHMAQLPDTRGIEVGHAYFAPPGRRAQMLREVEGASWPLVVSFLGFDVNVLPHKLGMGYFARIFARAECLTVSSRYMKRRLLALGAPAERVRLLPLGLPMRRFEYAQRALEPGQPLRLLSAARLVKIKGLEWGLRGVAQAVERGVELRWDIFGEGPLLGELEALAAELGVRDRVVFHGFQTMEVVRATMAHAHVGLFPGIRTSDGAEEALGGAVLEAQASGLPVIASDAGGIQEGFLPGVSGLLVRQASAEAIADAIVALVEAPEQIAAMGRAGRDFIAQRFDAGALNARWERLYAGLAAGRLLGQEELYPFDIEPGAGGDER